MAAQVESIAVVVEGSRQSADLWVSLQHDGLEIRGSQQLAGSCESRGTRADDEGDVGHGDGVSILSGGRRFRLCESSVVNGVAKVCAGRSVELSAGLRGLRCFNDDYLLQNGSDEERYCTRQDPVLQPDWAASWITATSGFQLSLNVSGCHPRMKGGA